MPTDNSPIWLLKKFGEGDVHGPVSFEKLREWADAAQINPQDSVSSDGKTWTKAPMIAELQMDWLVEVPDNPLYGPTTSGALLEFLRMGEIHPDTHIVNCCTGETLTLSQAPFYRSDDPETLASRIEELEADLRAARETISQLRTRLAEFEIAS
ncbi:MAG: GYF domain-containing protein [Verrucomicrobiota bacterium]